MRDRREPLKGGTILHGQRGKYTILDSDGFGQHPSLFAEGGSSLVYIAKASPINEKAAKEEFDWGTVLIKEIYPRAKDRGDNNCMRREGVRLHHENERIVARLKNNISRSETEFLATQNIARNSDLVDYKQDCFFDETTGTQYIVNAYRSHLIPLYKYKKEYSLIEALQIAKNLCYALADFHDNSWLHLDISPDNILVTKIYEKTESIPKLRLIDFNSAHRYDKASGRLLSCDLSRENISVKLGYSAKEIVDKREFDSISVASDLYSVAAVMFWAIFGETYLGVLHSEENWLSNPKFAKYDKAIIKKTRELLEQCLCSSEAERIKAIRDYELLLNKLTTICDLHEECVYREELINAARKKTVDDICNEKNSQRDCLSYIKNGSENLPNNELVGSVQRDSFSDKPRSLTGSSVDEETVQSSAAVSSSSRLIQLESSVGDDIKSYLAKYSGQSRFIKTINARPEDLYDVKVSYSGKIFDSSVDVIKIMSPGDILFLLGGSGAGKTYALLRAWKALNSDFYCIFVRLNTFGEETTVESRIRESVFADSQEKYDEFSRFLKGQRGSKNKPVILLLDGFNELSKLAQDRLYAELAGMAAEMHLVIVISSRYSDAVEQYVSKSARLKKLDIDDDVQPYLSKKKVPKELLHNEIYPLLRNPLMLNLFVTSAKERNDHGGILKFYAPVASESTLIWNFLQHDPYKKADNKAIHMDDVSLTLFAVNLVLPYICYKMQKSETQEDRFHISWKRLEIEIQNAIEYYQHIDLERFAQFANLNRVSGDNCLKAQIANTDSYKRIKDIFISTQLFGEWNSERNGTGKHFESLFSLQHQEFRDCLAAIHLLNGMEICGENEMLKELLEDNICCNPDMLHHLSNFAKADKREVIDAQWSLAKGKAGETKLFVKNLVAIYAKLLDGDYTSIDFSDIDASYVSLSSECFQPPASQSLFENTTFGTKTFPLSGHSDRIVSLVACGESVVSRGPDTIRIFNAGTSECINILHREGQYDHYANDLGVDILPIDEGVVAYTDGSRVVEIDTRKDIKKFYESAGAALSFVKYSPNGDYLVAHSKSSKLVTVWKRNSESVLLPIKGFDFSSLVAPAVSDSLIAYCPKPNELYVCELNSPRVRYSLPIECKDGYISAVSFFLNESAVAVSVGEESVSGGSSTIICFRIEEASAKPNIIATCNSIINTIRINQDGTLLAAATEDRKAFLWSVKLQSTPTKGKLVGQAIEGATAVSFFYNARRKDVQPCLGFADGSIQVIEVFEQNDGSAGDSRCNYYLGERLTGHKPNVSDFSVCSNGDVLIAAYSDGNIRQWDYKRRTVGYTYSKHVHAACCVKYANDGKLFASGHVNGSLLLWDTEKKVCIGECIDDDAHAHDDRIRDLVFTNDGRLFSCSNDGKIKAWDVKTRRLLAVLDKHTDFVKCLLFFEDAENKLLVSGSTDKNIIVWDIFDNKKEYKPKYPEIRKHTARIRSMALCANKNTFVSYADDGCVYEWDIITGRQTDRSLSFSAYQRPSESIAISTDGEKLLLMRGGWGVADNDTEVFIEEWDFSKKEKTHEVLAHRGSITALSYASENGLCLSSSYDGSIAISNIRESAVVYSLIPKTDISECLDGYNLDTVKYDPEWVDGYFRSPLRLSSKVKALPTDEKLAEFAVFLRQGILKNPFDFIPKNLSFEDSENQLGVLVDLILENTEGLYYTGSRADIYREKNFLLANFMYLYCEAPSGQNETSEQNMLMLCELLEARLDSQNREDDRNYQCSLDGLFNILRAKNPSHRALTLYDGFLRESGKKHIVKSCLKRIYMISGFYKELRVLPSNILGDTVQLTELYTETFIANTNLQAKYQDEIERHEKNCLLAIMKTVTKSNSWDKADVITYVQNLADEFIRDKQFRGRDDIMMFLSTEKCSVVAKILVSIMSRLNFWCEFDRNKGADAFKSNIRMLTASIPIHEKEELTERASQGDIDICCELGEKLYREKKYKESLEWFCKAESKTSSQYHIGLMHYLGQGTDKNNGLALEWFKKSAANHDKRAKYYLGVMYESGDGVRKNKLTARKLYAESSAQGCTSATRALANNCCLGFRLFRNYKKAFKLFQSLPSDASNLCSLGVMYWKGHGCKKDYKRAIECLKQSAKSNNRAQYLLGIAYLKGRIGLPKDYELGIEWLVRAAGNGSYYAQQALVLGHSNGKFMRVKFEKDDIKAAYWHKKAVACGNPLWSIRFLASKFNCYDESDFAHLKIQYEKEMTFSKTAPKPEIFRQISAESNNETSSVSGNSACICGSGRKYKNCCGMESGSTQKKDKQ